MEPTTTNAVAQNAAELVNVARLVAAALSIGLGAFGAAIGEGLIASKALEAMGRNPEAADNIFPKMIVGMALCESTCIFALVMSLIIFFVK